MTELFEAFLWNCAQRLGDAGLAAFYEYDARHDVLLPAGPGNVAGDRSVEPPLERVSMDDAASVRLDFRSALARFVASRYLSSGEEAPVVITALSGPKGRREVARYAPGCAEVGGAAPDFAAWSAIVLSGRRRSSRLAGVLLLSGKGTARIPREDVAGLAGECAAHVSARRKWRGQVQLARVLTRLESPRIPRALDDVCHALVEALREIGPESDVLAPVKHISYWSCSLRDDGTALGQQVACSYGTSEPMNRAKGWALLGSALMNPPSQDLYCRSADQWARALADLPATSDAPRPSGMTVRERLSRVRRNLCDERSLLAGGALDEADLAVLIPVFSDRTEGERLRLKGLLALFVDRDAGPESLPDEFIDQLSRSVASALDRVRLWQNASLRASIAEATHILFSGEQRTAGFLGTCAEKLQEALDLAGLSVFLYDRSGRQLYLAATTGIHERQHQGTSGRRVPASEYSRVRYSAQSPGKGTWGFFEPFAQNTPGSAPAQRLCFRSADNDFACEAGDGSCSRFSEAQGTCHFRADTVMRDREGRGVGLLRCANRGAKTGVRLPTAFPSDDECDVIREFADALGGLLDSQRRSENSDQLLRKIGHELPLQIGLMLQNLDEIEDQVSAAIQKAGRRGALPAHLQNLLDETGYSALVVQYLTNISTLLSLTPTQVEYSKRPLKVQVLLAKVLERIRHQARERGIYVRYSDALERARPVIRADRSFDLALINMINNAVQYSAFCTCPVIDWADRGDHCELSVSDLGIPLPRDVPVGSIFEDGYRSPEAKAVFSRGTGFGLTVALHVLEAHGFGLTPHCAAEPVATRDVFALDVFARLGRSWLPDLRRAGIELGVGSGQLIDARRGFKAPLELTSAERDALDTFSEYRLPDAAETRIGRIPLQYLLARLDFGDDLEILWRREVERSLYKVVFTIRIPGTEVVR